MGNITDRVREGFSLTGLLTSGDAEAAYSFFC
jgi:hypothetical protein